MKAIKSIDDFLGCSTAMLILWDPTYFERVWCVFEVGTFLAMNPNAPAITFVPISLFCVELAVTITAIIFDFGIVFGNCTNLCPQFLRACVDLGIPREFVWLALMFSSTLVASPAVTK